MKPRVLLVNAPTIHTKFIGADNYFPIGLLYLASVIRNNNMEASVLDINNHFFKKNLNEDLLSEYLNANFYNYVGDYNPDIIGIGCTFSGAFNSLKIIAKGIKDRFSGVPIVIGGIHPTLFAKEILGKYNFVDYVVIGEGEDTFLELVNSIATNVGNKALASLDGIAFRDNGQIKLNPKKKFKSNLDELPFVDYSIIDVNEYSNDTSNWYSPKKMRVGQPFSIISSRSCPNRCNFCSMWLVHGPKFRFRSAANVLDEIESLYKNYNVRYFQFMDDNMTFDKKRTLEICQGIRSRKMDIQFDIPNGLAINKLDQEIIDAMVEAGMVYASLAIESGSDYIRNKIMKKGLEKKKIYEVVEACAKHSKLFIRGFFIIGMPEDTHETLQDTYEMIENLPFDKISVNFVAPYPGTELFSYCVQNNLLKYKQLDYTDIEVFQDRDTYPHFKPFNLTTDDLVVFRQKCFDYMARKRIGLGLPENYPIRFKE